MAQMVRTADKMADMRSFLQRRSGELQSALPKSLQLDAGRFTRVVLTNFQLNPALLDCSKASLYVCMLQAAQFGLELDPVLGHAYLVPYKGKAQLIIGYKGYMAMARRSGEVTSINASVVREKDTFDFDAGLDRRLVHKPYLGPEDPGPVIAAYVCARFKSGDYDVRVMSRRDIDKIRTRSRASSAGPWVTDYEAMAIKTVIRQAVKFWPSSVELQRAAELDDAMDSGRDQVFTLDAGDYQIEEDEPEQPKAEPVGKLDRLAQATPPPAAPPPPPPPQEEPPQQQQKAPPPPAPQREEPPPPPPPPPPQDESPGRQRARQEVQERHEPRRGTTAPRQQPSLMREREPGEEG